MNPNKSNKCILLLYQKVPQNIKKKLYKTLLATGPDGLPSAYYKSFSDVLNLNLASYVSSVILGGYLRTEILQAPTNMPPKPGNGAMVCVRYHSIFLRNIDASFTLCS